MGASCPHLDPKAAGPTAIRMDLCSSERLKSGFGLLDAGQARFAAQDYQGFKERRRVLASADGDPYGLEGLPGLQPQMHSGGAESLIERIVIERGGG